MIITWAWAIHAWLNEAFPSSSFKLSLVTITNLKDCRLPEFGAWIDAVINFPKVVQEIFLSLKECEENLECIAARVSINKA